MSGYPNLFFTAGPNSGPGHNSLLVYVEGQFDYAVSGIKTVLDLDLCYLDVRADVQPPPSTSARWRTSGSATIT